MVHFENCECGRPILSHRKPNFYAHRKATKGKKGNIKNIKKKKVNYIPLKAHMQYLVLSIKIMSKVMGI